MRRTARPPARTPTSASAKPDRAARAASDVVGPLLSAGFALMALVPILLALFLLDRGEGGVVGLPGIVVVLMVLSALSGFFLIRRELTRMLVSVVRSVSREATDDLSDRIREASEDEIGKISSTIQSITSRLQEKSDGAERVRNRVDDGIGRIAHAVQAAGSTEQLVSLVVEGALACVAGRTAYLVGVDEDGGDFVTRAAAGEEAGVALGWRIPLGEGVPGRCARERRAISLLGPDGADDARPAFAKAPQSTVAAPVLLGETLFGILVVHDRADGSAALGEEEAAVLGGYASIAATTIGSWGPRDRLEKALDETLGGLSAAIEARDPYARGHAARVARYCEEMAKSLRLDADTVRALRRAALVHDIGKLGLPETLLRKEGRFTPEELEIVRTHAAAGEKLLRSIPALASLAPLVRHHHERCDGSGYPEGLKADAIPLPTHVLIVANAYDIMTSDRSYRKAMSMSEALETIRSKTGTWYERRAARALLDLDPAILSVSHGVAEAGATVKGRGTASVSVRD